MSLNSTSGLTLISPRTVPPGRSAGAEARAAAPARASSRVVWPRSLVEPSGAPDLAPERERLLELGLDLRPGLRAPALVQHRAQDAVDSEPGMPEAGVGLGHPAQAAAVRRASFAVASIGEAP